LEPTINTKKYSIDLYRLQPFIDSEQVRYKSFLLKEQAIVVDREFILDYVTLVNGVFMYKENLVEVTDGESIR